MSHKLGVPSTTTLLPAFRFNSRPSDLHPLVSNSTAMACVAFSSSVPLCMYTSQRQSKILLQMNSSFAPGPSRASITAPETALRKEDIVIVGAGIAGLATAVSLYRVGIGSLVLEQAESLRTGGTSLTLFKNGWRVLDAMGVGKDLRAQFLEIEGMVVKTDDGRELRSFRFKDDDPSQEVRAVERRVLLETLASRLPQEAVQFSSKLANIETSESGETLLELTNGTRLLAQIVIGCDGIRSPVAKWIAFSEPKYVGHCAFRGLGHYPEGQPFRPRVHYIYGRGLRAGYVPVSPTKVYWFICFNSPSTGPRVTDPVLLKKQAKELTRNWPEELLSIIDASPDETVIKTPLVDRWLWPGVRLFLFLPGPAQSNVWETTTVPSKKRTCFNRPKQSSVEKLTKDLRTILDEQQSSYFSGSSEEELLFESATPMVSFEIGHGSVLIRHPRSLAREEESEASSLSVENKHSTVNEAYSHYMHPVHNEGKGANFSIYPMERQMQAEPSRRIFSTMRSL